MGILLTCGAAACGTGIILGLNQVCNCVVETPCLSSRISNYTSRLFKAAAISTVPYSLAKYLTSDGVPSGVPVFFYSMSMAVSILTVTNFQSRQAMAAGTAAALAGSLIFSPLAGLVMGVGATYAVMNGTSVPTIQQENAHHVAVAIPAPQVVVKPVQAAAPQGGAQPIPVGAAAQQNIGGADSAEPSITVSHRSSSFSSDTELMPILNDAKSSATEQ